MIDRRQSTYWLVLWENGVSSVHPDEDQAIHHVRSLRGDVENYALRNRSQERIDKWRKTKAHIIEVSRVASYIT